MDNPSATPAPKFQLADILLVGMLTVVGVFALLFALRLLLDTLTLTSVELQAAIAAGAAIIQGVVMLAAIAFGLWRMHLAWDTLGLEPLTPWQVIESVIAFVLLRLASVGVLSLMTQAGFVNSQPNVLAPTANALWTITITLLFAGIIIPIAEELFFRGMVFGWMRERWGVWPAILLSGVVFGLIHIQPAVAIPAGLLGIGLAWLYQRHRSLWSPILVHALNNATALLLLYVLVIGGWQPPTP
jgi:uncharacterized protein